MFSKCKLGKQNFWFWSIKKSQRLWWITFAKMKNCCQKTFLSFLFFVIISQHIFLNCLTKQSKTDGKVRITTTISFLFFSFLVVVGSIFSQFWNRIGTQYTVSTIYLFLSSRYFETYSRTLSLTLKMRVETILKESCNFQKADEVICCINFSSTAVGKINGL